MLPVSGCEVNAQDTENIIQQVVAQAGTFSRMRAHITTVAGAGTSHTFTLRVNGAASTLTCTIGGAADTVGSDLVNQVHVVEGDLISISSVPAVNPTATRMRISMQFQPD